MFKQDTLDIQQPKEKLGKNITLTGGEFLDNIETGLINIGVKETLIEKKENVEVISSGQNNKLHEIPSRTAIYQHIQDDEAVKIVRTHYTKSILDNLDWISENFDMNEPDSLPVFNEMFATINEYIINSPKDPFSSLLQGLYEGLVFNSMFLNLEACNYINISKILKNHNNRKNLSYKDVDKALIKLESLGINSTPF
ncbi:MAG: hypothetical protein OQJ96_01430 [Flavobacteriales bacterium]|nr:hypothetical protein [Flavobacteriales bacterium]MCW8912584.1 hypothetical protein [Flavobacteriales bacterium]MCW8938189.1 hypothetical protein [Flavobacteriales bacterium]MCW8941021.1 hypothetical protein [Flavobacteriales bacterium]MCW8967019.1 hypothetical protein [Flavobacteriales bacterium]